MRIAATCALLGFFAVVLAAALGAVGGAEAAGSADGLAVADSALGAAAGADSALGAAGASTACTAAWQDDVRLDIFFCRHCSDASPPGGTLVNGLHSPRGTRIGWHCAVHQWALAKMPASPLRISRSPATPKAPLYLLMCRSLKKSFVVAGAAASTEVKFRTP